MSESPSKEELIGLAAEWIREHSPNARAGGAELSPDTQLLATGLIDSLGLVDLLAFLEKATGAEIDLLELDEDEIGTLEGLCRAAVSSTESSQAGGA